MKTKNFKNIIALFLSLILALPTAFIAVGAEPIAFESGVKIRTSAYTSFEGGAPSQKNGGTAISIGKALYFELVPPSAGVYLLELQHKRNASWNINIESAFTENDQKEVISLKTLTVSTDNSSNNVDDWDTEEGNMYWEDLGYAAFPTTNKRILMVSNRNTRSDNGPWTGAIRLTKLEPVNFVAAYVDDEVVSEPIPAYTDAMTIEFDGKLADNVLENAKAVITDANGNELAAKVHSVNSGKNKLTVAFCEALEADKTYTLNVKGFKDAAGYPAEEGKTHSFDVEFSTLAEADDALTSKITLDPLKIDGMKFEVTGTVTGSLNQPIKGRTVGGEILAPNDGAEPVALEDAVTDENGKFTLNYEIADENKEVGGIYTVTVTSDYASDKETSGVYVSDKMVEDIVGSVENMTTAEEVQTYLEEGNGDQLGFDAEEIKTLLGEENVGGFYKRLADADYRKDGKLDMTLFNAVCYEAKILEDILVNGAEAIEKNLDDEDVQDAISLEADKYSLLTNRGAKGDYIEEIDALSEISDFAILGEKCNELLDEYVLKEYNKSKFSLNLTDVSTVEGKAVDIPLHATPYSMDICEFTIYVDCPDAKTAQSVEIKDTPAGTVTKDVKGNTAIFTVSDIALNKTITGFGIPVFSYANKGTVTLTVRGTVTYNFEGVKIKEDINKATVDVLVTENTKKPSGSTSSRPSGNGGGSYAPVKVPEVLPSSNNEIKFDDLDTVKWAEDSIYALAKKGIISRAENKKFRPDDSVTRAEFIKMLIIAINASNSGTDIELKDVPYDAWYYISFKMAYNRRIIFGDENGNFNPNDKLTRQDMCVMLSRTLDWLKIEAESNVETAFTDDAQISSYAKDAVYRMRNLGIVNGVGDGSFAPKSDATRAATAKMIHKFIEEANL